MPRPQPEGPPGTAWFGGHPDKVRLCLWILGDTLDPDAVTQALGCVPTRSKRKGQPILAPTGEIKRLARTGSWLLATEVGDDATIEEAILALFDGLVMDQGIWTQLTSQYQAELISELTLKCFNRGFTIAPEVLSLLGERGIALNFDIYYLGDLQERDAVLGRIDTTRPGAHDDRPGITARRNSSRL